MNSSRSDTGPDRLRRRLDTLGVKLFLAIAGANLVLVMAVYLVYSWSFDKGLVDYVNQSEEARLTPITSRLAEGYRSHGSWQWLTEDRDQWNAILGDVLGWRFGRRESRAERQADRTREETAANRGIADSGIPLVFPQPSFRDQRSYDENIGPLPPITIDWRVMLLGADQSLLIPYPGGEQSDVETAVKLPVRVDGAIVGYLGYIPRLQLVQSLESITAIQQSRRFGAIGIGMFAAVLLTAAVISHWLSRRLRALGQGATALARGDYGMRIAAHGHDELARLAGDFNHLAEALEAAQRGRQQWIADIAHELRTPLATLRAEIEAVQDGVRPLTQASMVSVAQEVGRLTRLVEDLRMLSLSDLGALTYRKEPVLLDEVIGDALDVIPATGTSQPQIEVSMQPGIVVDADADRLAQVFANLMQNTLRYSEPPVRLRVVLSAEGNEARIDWEDSPPGVRPEDLPRLTDRLYRVDESRSSASGGSGLGLAIVQAIVAAHGGRMQASHSTLGGLRWSIWLPIADRRT